MRLRDSILGAFAAITLATTPVVAATGFSAVLTGSAEVPPVSTAASGAATCVLNTAGTQLQVSVAFQNLTTAYTASHIHGYSTAGVNSSVRFGFTCTLTNANRDGTFNGTWNLSATDATNLTNGLCYVNIHSTTFGGGELRGQLMQDQSVAARNTTWGRMKALYR
ncbi:MAG: CHRD domain-containing protein [Candidatus Eisenbacteria bacterium]